MKKEQKKEIDKKSNIFYVYGFYYKSNDNPFYIGKGCANRYKCISRRSKKFNEVINNNEYYSKIIHNNLFENIALQIEEKLINEIEGLINVTGIIKNRKCPLCKREDVEFSKHLTMRRCNDCMKETNENRRIEKEKVARNTMIDYLSKGEIDMVNLYNLINKKK